jgi:hypothetical protein
LFHLPDFYFSTFPLTPSTRWTQAKQESLLSVFDRICGQKGLFIVEPVFPGGFCREITLIFQNLNPDPTQKFAIDLTSGLHHMILEPLNQGLKILNLFIKTISHVNPYNTRSPRIIRIVSLIRSTGTTLPEFKTGMNSPLV